MVRAHFSPIADRLACADWAAVQHALDEQGWSLVPSVLTASECRHVARDYQRDELYRSTVDMERHRFGRGQYRYFTYPLPPLVEALRHAFYCRLFSVANAWAERLQLRFRYPSTLSGFLERCHAAGQTRPTPLVLRYGPGDYNRLHQDVYGPLRFPLQVLLLLSQSSVDYTGGEVIFVEQRPREQSKAVAVTPRRGDAVVFTNRERPIAGKRSDYRVQMRHGASTLSSGQRMVLGIIFHDAE